MLFCPPQPVSCTVMTKGSAGRNAFRATLTVLRLRLPLGLALGSPIFPSGCEGQLGVALESLQGRRDLTYGAGGCFLNDRQG